MTRHSYLNEWLFSDSKLVQYFPYFTDGWKINRSVVITTAIVITDGDLRNRRRHCKHIALTSLKENELVLMLISVLHFAFSILSYVKKMKNRLYDTVFNFAAYYILIKLGYWLKHSPLVELRSFFWTVLWNWPFWALIMHKMANLYRNIFDTSKYFKTSLRDCSSCFSKIQINEILEH